MEDKGTVMTADRNENGRSDLAESERPKRDANSIPHQGTGFSEEIQSYTIDFKSGKDVAEKEEPHHSDPSVEVNTEAEVTINPDDVIRAGGFGARDDISSLLPVASDSTDFEASLLDARDYEEPQGEQHRPGLGWREQRESE